MIRMPRLARFLLYNLPAWLNTPTEPISLSYPVLEQQPSDKGNDFRFSTTLKQVSPNIFVWGSHQLLQGLDILRNVIVSGYVTFYQVNKFFVNKFFIIDKTSSGPDLVREP